MVGVMTDPQNTNKNLISIGIGVGFGILFLLLLCALLYALYLRFRLKFSRINRKENLSPEEPLSPVPETSHGPPSTLSPSLTHNGTGNRTPELSPRITQPNFINEKQQTRSVSPANLLSTTALQNQSQSKSTFLNLPETTSTGLTFSSPVSFSLLLSLFNILPYFSSSFFLLLPSCSGWLVVVVVNIRLWLLLFLRLFLLFFRLRLTLLLFLRLFFLRLLFFYPRLLHLLPLFLSYLFSPPPGFHLLSYLCNCCCLGGAGRDGAELGGAGRERDRAGQGRQGGGGAGRGGDRQ
ncbi:hypothetical protein Hamer_G022260 [Homarus americanus]|uniref:Uncharacterized protein n=1 Tax=Homarus americanus TaxID=6706 RepID=A0A8J5JR97_HOMAM|nr:hypothetical protein Hamer_G022260 [Homarus americanus]